MDRDNLGCLIKGHQSLFFDARFIPRAKTRCVGCNTPIRFVGNAWEPIDTLEFDTTKNDFVLRG